MALQTFITDGITSVSRGETVTYNILIRNFIDAAAVPLTIGSFETTPFTNLVDITIESFNIVGGATANLPLLVNNQLVGTITNLPLGGAVLYEITGKVSPDAPPGLLGDIGVVATFGALSVFSFENDTIVKTPFDLGISITDNLVTVAQATGFPTNLDFTITATNSDPNPATGVTIVTTLSPSVESVSNLPPNFTFDASTKVLTGTNLTIPPSGQDFTFTATVAPNTPIGTVLGTTATIAPPFLGDDIDLSNNTAVDITTVSSTTSAIPAAIGDLAVTVTDSQTEAAAGSTLSYTITASNLGANPASNVTITSTLPSEIVSVSNLPAGFTAVVNNGIITVTGSAINLAAGASSNFSFNALVSSNAAPGTEIVNQVSISSASISDSNTTNNNNSDNTLVSAVVVPPNPVADLAVTVTDGLVNVAAGDTLPYTITARNLGANPASNVTITSTLPSEIASVSNLPAGFTAVVNNGVITVTGSAINLAAGASSNFSFNALVSSNAAPGTEIVNQVSISSTSISDSNTTNNSASDLTRINPIVVPPSPIDKPKPVTPITPPPAQPSIPAPTPTPTPTPAPLNPVILPPSAVDPVPAPNPGTPLLTPPPSFTPSPSPSPVALGTLRTFSPEPDTRADRDRGTTTGGRINFTEFGFTTLNDGDNNFTVNDQSAPNVLGLSGNDFITGSSGNNLLYGNQGLDSLFGAGGDDQLFGGAGSDSLDGGSGNDRLFGNLNNDILLGGIGNDTLHGGQGDDVLFGGAGDDLLVGDRGRDFMTGGTGADIFVLRGFGTATANITEADIILDFQTTEGDRIGLDGTPFNRLTFENIELFLNGSTDGFTSTVIRNPDNNLVLGIVYGLGRDLFVDSPQLFTQVRI